MKQIKKVRHKKSDKEKKELSKLRIFSIVIILFSIILSTVYYIITKNYLNAIFIFIGVSGFFIGYIFVKRTYINSLEIKKMETSFPDFLDLMSSNLRAGMTVDQAILLSSRKEFSPLDKEIEKLGKDMVTGERIEIAIDHMSARVTSEKIQKTLKLISSGIRSGGNLAVLLDETASNLREKEFVEKKAASNVLMYIIFIVFAIAVGAPALFALSTVLVQVMGTILSQVPTIDASIKVPFTLSKINISEQFITFYAITFLIATDILGSIIMGLVSKGQEKAGIKYIFPLLAFSLGIFFTVKITLGQYFANVFG